MENVNPYAADLPQAAADDQSTAGDLRRVHTGVSLVFYGFLLWVGCIFAGIPQAMVSVAVPALEAVVLILLALLHFGSAAMIFAGRIFCLSAPSQAGRRRIYAAVGLDAMAIVVVVGGWLFEMPPLLVPLGGAFALLANIIFVLFLMSLTTLLDRPDLAKKALLILKLGVAEVLAIVGFVVGLLVQLPVLVLPCAMLVLPLMLVQLIYYALLLWGIKNALQPPSMSLA